MIRDLKEKKLWIPLLLTAVCAVMLRVMPVRALTIYVIYYAMLFAFFIPWMRPGTYFKSFRKPRAFWLPVLLTLLALTAVYFLRGFLLRLQEHYYGDALLTPYINHSLDLWLYGITFLILMPVSAGLFYRGTYILHEDKRITAGYLLLYAFIECLLYVDPEHPIGIVSALLPMIPLTVSLLLTRNPRIPITAHVLFNAYDKVGFVVYSFVRAASDAGEF